MARNRGRGMQFLDVLPEDGERRLMLAVLIDAIRIYSLHRPTSPHIHAYRDWLRERAWFQNDDRSGAFSFLPICDALGLNPEYVRRCVLQPSAGQRPVRVRRYAAKAEEAWQRQRRGYQASPAACQAAVG